MTKTPRFSLTSSWVIFGTWKSITVERLAKLDPFSLGKARDATSQLLAVQLDDELLCDRGVDLLALRPLQHLAGETLVVGLQPRGDGSGEVGRVADDLLGGGAALERDDVVGTYTVARDVDPAPVDGEVAVANELARLGARGGEAEAV